MPSAPRKPYCQPCKQRRIKCDEKWPVCSPCMRKGIECPGPSTMLKFVVTNSHSIGRDEKDKPVSSSRSEEAGNASSKLPGTLVLADRPGPSAVNATRRGSKFRSYRLLNPWSRSAPMNSCDRVSARLITLMSSSPDQSQILFRPLKEFPARLSLSECLKDSVAYWCSSWVDSHHGLQAPSLTTWNYYGKLLRSLQRALQGPQALSIETLAAAIIIYRAYDVFNLGQPSNGAVEHVQGVVALNKRRGLPNLDDPLEVQMAFDQQDIMGIGDALGPEADFYSTEPWIEAREKVIQQVLLSEDAQEIDVLSVKYDIRIEGFTRELKLFNENPGSYLERAVIIEMGLRQHISDIEALLPDHWAYTEEKFGTIPEIVDLGFFVGRRYALESLPAYAALVTALEAPIIPCLMISHLRKLYNLPPDEEFNKTIRHVCTRLWMFIPFLSTQDPLCHDNIILGFTTEAATEVEKEHILDFIESMNANGDRGKDRDDIIKTISKELAFVRGEYKSLAERRAEIPDPHLSSSLEDEERL